MDRSFRVPPIDIDARIADGRQLLESVVGEIECATLLVYDADVETVPTRVGTLKQRGFKSLRSLEDAFQR